MISSGSAARTCVSSAEATSCGLECVLQISCKHLEVSGYVLFILDFKLFSLLVKTIKLSGVRVQSSLRRDQEHAPHNNSNQTLESPSKLMVSGLGMSSERTRQNRFYINLLHLLSHQAKVSAQQLTCRHFILYQ